MSKILIFGLPGSGKTTFAKKLISEKKIAYFNADEVRKMFNDWDFTEAGRIRQAQRMIGINCVCTRTLCSRFCLSLRCLAR
jgi:adenylylsulfate kinase